MKKHPASWACILKSTDNNEGLAYIVRGTLDLVTNGVGAQQAFSDACENENFYGMRDDIVADRIRAARILKDTFGYIVPDPVKATN